MYRTDGGLSRRALWLGGAALGLLALLLGLLLLVVPVATQAANTLERTTGGASPANPQAGSLVISQVYGGGGNAGAPYQNDFIELFNPTSAPISVNGWSVQYGSSGGTTWTNSTALPNVTIPAGRYFLIQEAVGSGCSGSPCGIALPAPDITGTINLSGTAGKVALVNTTTALSGACPIPNANVLDFVGYGTANCAEGTPTSALSNTTAALRNGNGCVDTDNNSADFTVLAPTPRNSSTQANPCAVGTATTTVTPGGPTNTTTATPSATSTPVPVGTSGVEIVMLYAYGYTTATPQPDEAVRLINTTGVLLPVGNWQIRNQAGGSITLPLTATLAAGQKIWIANTASGFRTYFGFNPDYEYGADTDPSVPQASATGGFTFADNGGAVQLYDNLNANQDTLVYGSGNPATLGWSGPALQYYLPSGQPGFIANGQIFNRKLDELTARPVPDTNTKDDWAQDDDPIGTATPGPNDRSNDDINGKKILHPGWALTNPAYEDMFFTKQYTDTNVTTKFLVEPDNGYDAVHNLIVSATQSITIETYEWHSLPLEQDILNAKSRGVQISVVIDGNPCCALLPDDETLWTAQQWEGAGIPVYFFSGTPATSDDTYRYNNTHAKIMVVDRQWVLTGADNFSDGSMTSDPRGNGTAGERGTMIITNAPDVVAYTLRLIGFDFRPGQYADMVRWNTAPGFGAPSPGYTPPPVADMTGYTPVKPTPLVVTETEPMEILQSPDNELRDVDSLIGLVNRAGPGDQVMVEQQYERKFWETSVTDGPNPRLEAYIAAARRGANVRILLDGFFEGGDCTSTTHNPATVAYVNGLGLPNLQARVAEPTSGYPVGGPPVPTTGNIHNKMDLVTVGALGYLHVTSINGSANANKLNREYGLQIQSNAGYLYYKDVFDYDWSVGYLPCGAGTPTPTNTPGGPTATMTGTATPVPTPLCNYLVNSDFETGNQAPWVTTTPGVSVSVVTTPVYAGIYAVGITHAFTATNGGSQGIQQDLHNILAGAIYRVQGEVYRPDSNIQSARVRVAWYTCADFSCSQASTTDVFAGNVGVPGWQFFTGTVTAPAGAVAARYRVLFYNATATPSTIYFDNLVFDCNGNATTTPVATATGTATQTVFPTVDGVTNTPTVTRTPTAPATNTQTITPVGATNTTTATRTATPQGTIPATGTNTATRTVTVIPTVTGPPQPTSTMTMTRTAGPATTITATPVLSRTPTLVPTHTPTQAPSATATPTACAVQFADVAPNDPFYTYIRCLVCRQILSGYTTSPPCASGQTPCYNGGANVTRGQVAKIVSNAAGYNDPIPSTQQTFTDVPYTNPFWVYIERLAEPGRGYISGYSTSPPCTTGVPCFLPFNNVTRGQMAKIDSNAGGFFDAIPSTQQTFTDVPNSNPFWVYIERAALHGVISGYSTSPPCPGGTPCFLWANNLTRNQAAKVVAVTFYPNCQTPAR